MTNLFSNIMVKIMGKLLILGFKIRAKRLACRLINVVCKGAEISDLLALVDKEYEKIDHCRNEMYVDLIAMLHDEFQPIMEEVTEEE